VNRNEAETRHDLIDPALKAAGWHGDGVRIRSEYQITKGRIQGNGQRGPALKADYVLEYKGQKLAVVEAKKESLPHTEGVGQAKDYAQKLQIRFTYSTNGHKFYGVDMATGDEGDIDSFPSPEELLKLTVAGGSEWHERLSSVPFESQGGVWQPRFYQEIAIDRVLDAIAADKKRILLTLATGTGKTAIAFQIAWRLFQTRWNLSGKPERRPRILFLADRNILADQAYNAFGAFPHDALVRIRPGEISKHGGVPKNGSVFFTIFQTFMTKNANGDFDGFNFGEYPSDFFDFIVIDECHRGGANDESNWRTIMDHFSPAVQLGLTATPKRDANVDTYKYFGEPVYTYSLKDGINDGFLTPFRVRTIASNLDDYIFRPGDEILQGEVEPGRVYTEQDFNRTIYIKAREEARVRQFLAEINPDEKTLVFCANQDHAAHIRDLINQNSPHKGPNYCVRVTSNDGDLGEQHLRAFQDNDKLEPTILTTSHKLSTGVDALNVRNIVLLRTINSMIEFKQIIGRGTRLFEGKNYFTVYDFVKAHHHFQDPDWDGEPQQPEAPKPTPPTPPRGPDILSDDPDEPTMPREKIIIKLRDGRERKIQYMKETIFMGPDGKPMTAQEFIASLFDVLSLPDYFHSEEELRSIWSDPVTRRALLNRLAEAGFGIDALSEIQKLIEAEQSDLFDVLEYIAFASEPITREQRVIATRPELNAALTSEQRSFVEFILARYIKTGVAELDDEQLPQLLELKYQAVADGARALGGADEARSVFLSTQKRLYEVI
jgi:type I restriction enzyme R subunit